MDNEEGLGKEDLVEVRRMVRTISKKTGNHPDAWVHRARAAFAAAAGHDGLLSVDDVNRVLEDSMKGGGDDGLAWQLAPMLFRLLDPDRDGRVTLKDFLMGQALLFSAARSGASQQLGEVCWRALDIAGNGVISTQEMGVSVGLMLHLGAIDPDHLRRIDSKVGTKQIARERAAVQFYMEMYDSQRKGHITREEFDKSEALQNNFRRLLTSEQLVPIFLAHRMTDDELLTEKRMRVNCAAE